MEGSQPSTTCKQFGKSVLDLELRKSIRLLINNSEYILCLLFKIYI